MPSLPIVLRLSQCSSYQPSVIGDVTAELTWLQQNVEVTPTLLIPTATLEKTLLAAKAVLKLKELLSDSQLSKSGKQKKLEAFFANLPVPQPLVSMLHHEYEAYLNKSQVQLVAADSKFGVTLGPIKGPVNILLSIKRFWLELLLHAQKNSQKTPNLFPCNILIQAIPKADNSGTIASHHHGGIHKSVVVIRTEVAQGTTAPSPTEEIQVDVRTFAVLRSAEHNLQYRNKKSVNGKRFLSNVQCQELTTHAIPLFRKKLGPLAVRWHLAPSGFVFTEILRSRTANQSIKPQSELPSATQVFTTANSISKMAAALPLVDGIGPINSSYLVHSAGLHPIETLTQASSKNVLKHNIHRSLFEIVSKKRDCTIFYKLYSADPQTRSAFSKMNSEYTIQSEKGAISGTEFLLTYQNWLQFELETLHEYLAKTPIQLRLILPELKNPEEFETIRKIILKSFLSKLSTTSLWVELTSPAVAHNLRFFSLENIGGLVISLDKLASTMMGVSLAQLASNPTSSFFAAVQYEILTTVSKQLMGFFDATKIPVFVLSNFFSEPLIKKIVSVGWQGVCVGPERIMETRSMIRSAEQLVLESKL